MPVPEGLKMGQPHSGVYVPETIATCPECGGVLVVQAHAWDEASNVPLSDGLDIDCVSDPLNDDESAPHLWHKHRQSDWQPVIDDIRKWTCAIDSNEA